MRLYPNQKLQIYPDSHPRGLIVHVSVIQTRYHLDWACGLAVMPDGKKIDVDAYRHTNELVWSISLSNRAGIAEKYTELLAS